MKILVIDDTQLHRASALETLAGHEVTVVDSYDTALLHLDRRVSYEATKAYMAEHLGIHASPKRSGSEDPEGWRRYREAENQAEKALRPPMYDAVLCDLLMPAGKDQQGPTGEKFVGQEIPVGFALALHAVLSGAKFVAVVSATNHHCHPAAAMLDRLSAGGGYWSDKGTKALFSINGATVGFFPYPKCRVDSVPCSSCSGTGIGPERGCPLRYRDDHGPNCPLCQGTKKTVVCESCEGTKKQGGAKDWGRVLAKLLGGVQQLTSDDPFVPKE